MILEQARNAGMLTAEASKLDKGTSERLLKELIAEGIYYDAMEVGAKKGVPPAAVANSFKQGCDGNSKEGKDTK